MMAKKNIGSALSLRFSQSISAFVQSNSSIQSDQVFAIAYSGGLDSSVLLSLATSYCLEHNIPLFAFHIHHGLSPNASGWMQHCRDTCSKYGVSFDGKEILVNNDDGAGIEASARSGRYHALGELSKKHNIKLLLTAHHQDDQAETILLQMLRGAGVAGLAGMNACHHAPKLFGDDKLLLGRPLLSVSRQELELFAAEHALSYVQDESNADHRYFRNALRQRVMPILGELSPGYAERIARAAIHIQSANDLLNEVSEQDWSECIEGNALNVSAVEQLSEMRRNNLLRLLLKKTGCRMPSTARLKEIVHQLLTARQDARVTVFHEHVAIHRYKERIYVADAHVEREEEKNPISFQWQGQPFIAFSEYHGSLYFDEGDSGIDATWLKQVSLLLHLRRGGERLKLGVNRSTRDMKSHYQTLQIPFWLRQQLPFVSVNNEVLFAAGVGMQSKFCHEPGTSLIRLRWVSDNKDVLPER
ncbi:tRNA lysidine(34) synthetase TilS [Undibacterium sp. SXout7W]|uniref:tRNA lysidine(34) synthetase TilS n=1 Tax=Undibacterium sp. SXout7W TaxID=3413049 RepID=UPI003BF1DE1A